MNPYIVFYISLGLVVLYCLGWSVFNVTVQKDKESRIYIVLFILCLVFIIFLSIHLS